jgi:hypothetical protein
VGKTSLLCTQSCPSPPPLPPLPGRIISPKKGVWKVYIATLAQPLVGKQAQDAARLFASGTMVLGGSETVPLLPAQLTMLDDTTAQVAISEGKYHQVGQGSVFAQAGAGGRWQGLAGAGRCWQALAVAQPCCPLLRSS